MKILRQKAKVSSTENWRIASIGGVLEPRRDRAFVYKDDDFDIKMMIFPIKNDDLMLTKC